MQKDKSAENRSNSNAVLGFIGFVIIGSIIFYFSVLMVPERTIIVEIPNQTENQKNSNEETSILISNEEIIEITQEEKKMYELIENGKIENCSSLTLEFQLICEEEFTYKKLEENEFKDISLCNDLEEYSKENCKILTIQNLEKNYLNENICSNENNEFVKTYCYDRYYLQEAISQNNPNLCIQSSNENDCRDRFTLNKLDINTIITIDCNSFFDEETINECKIIQKTNSTQIKEVCSNFNSIIFGLCA